MKKLSLILFLSLFVTLLTLSAMAEETVIYQNNFSSTSLSDFHLYKSGSWIVENGKLKTKGSGTSTFLSYEIPALYEGMGYQIDVDMYDASSMGGILVGATADIIAGKTPSYFYGFTCTTTNGTVTPNTEKAYIGYFNQSGGWGGNFPPSTQPIPKHTDLHLMVRVEKGVMIYRVTSLDKKTKYYGIRYEIGDADGDFYTDFTRTVGLRDYYNDTASFDNLKITVISDDPIPTPDAPVNFCGIDGMIDGALTLDDNVLNGNGYFMTEDSLSNAWSFRSSVYVSGKTYAYFGVKENGCGYAVVLDPYELKISVHRILYGVWSCLGEKMTPIPDGLCELRIESSGTVLSVYYDNLYQGSDAFPKFELNINKITGKIGFYVDGSVQGLVIGSKEAVLSADSYLNPVCWGADPDMLYYNGTYYLYNKVSDSKLFRVYTSPDLVHFTARNYIFDPSTVPSTAGINIKSSWSPNVFYNEGIFYLIFAAHPTGNSNIRHLYYATSDSPYGPFTMKTYEPINPNANEIDGHPYRDDNGKIYLSLSRYDEGGTVWMQEATFKDGVIKTVGEAHRIVSADREWDTDGYIRLCEGGGFYKHNGLYYFIYCTGSYARHYGEAYAVSDSVFGPYTKVDYNPFLIYNAELDGPGDALILPSPDGEELWLIYHRHNEVGTVNPRQTCIDKIEFVPDPNGGPDILTVHGPTNTMQTSPSHKYRYDVNRDGSVTEADANVIRQYLAQNTDYTGIYDVNADGKLTDADAEIIETIIASRGDLNIDGQINNNDITLMIRYLCGWTKVVTTPVLADVNRDSTVNNRDAILLIQTVSEWIPASSAKEAA